MSEKRIALDERAFSYVATARGSVQTFYYGRHVSTLASRSASKFLSQAERLSDAGDAEGLQLLMAKATGNFKRGNERP